MSNAAATSTRTDRPAVLLAGATTTALPARTGDGNDWVSGWYWLWWGHRRAQVSWIGRVRTCGGAKAPQYACEPCLAHLHMVVGDYTEAADHLPIDDDGRDIPLYSAPTARHPLPARRSSPQTPHPALAPCSTDP